MANAVGVNYYGDLTIMLKRFKTFNKLVIKKLISGSLALIMLLQGFAGVFNTYKQVAIGLSALVSVQAFAAGEMPSMDYTTLFKNNSENGFGGLFDQDVNGSKVAGHESVDHSNKSAVESKGKEVLESLKQDSPEAYEMLSNTYNAGKQEGAFSEELAGIKTFNSSGVDNIFTSASGGCEDIVQNSIVENTVTRFEYESCSKSAPLDLKMQLCQIERSFKAASLSIPASQNGIAVSPGKAFIDHSFVNAEGLEVANANDDVKIAESNISYVFNVENSALLGDVSLHQILFPGEVSVFINGGMVYQGGGVEFDCGLIGSTCQSESPKVQMVSPIELNPNIVNGVNTLTIKLRSVYNYANLELDLRYPNEPFLVESLMDSPAGCSTGQQAGVFNGVSVPIYNLDAGGEVLPAGSPSFFTCTDSSNTRFAEGSSLAVNKAVFGNQLTELYSGSDLVEVCYKATANQALYLGDVVACSGSECADEIRGKTYSQISQESSENSSCGELKANTNCEISKQTCIDETGGVCTDWDVEYACKVTDKFESVVQKNSQDCGIPVCDKFGNCQSSSERGESDFAEVAAQLSVFQMARADMSTNIDNGNITVFKGEKSTCRSMQLYGLGGNCCKGITGVGPLELVSTLYAASKNEWIVGKYSSAMASLGETAVGQSVQSGYQMMADGLANSWDAIQAPFQEAYTSLFEQTASVATDALASGGSSAVTSGATSFFAEVAGSITSLLEDIMMEVYQKVYESMGHEVGKNFFSVVGGEGGLVNGLSAGVKSALTVVGWVYTAYVIAKLIIALITQCKKSEYATQVKAKQKNCIYQGQRCSSKDWFGNCVEKKKTYCCFKSPLARIISEQGSRQIGKDSCTGFTQTQLSRINFDKIDLSEWTNYLKKSGVVPSAEEAKASIDKKFMEANVAKSLNLSEYSTSSERVASTVSDTGYKDTLKGVKNDIYVNRSGVSSEGYIQEATVVYDEMPEVKEWHDVLMVESKYNAKKKTPKIFTYKFPEKAGYRLVYSTKKPSGYPSESSSGYSWDSDDSGNLISRENTSFNGSCTTQSKDIYRLKSAGEVFTLGGYAITDNYNWDCDDNDNWDCGQTEEWVCDYDVKIYKRVLK